MKRIIAFSLLMIVGFACANQYIKDTPDFAKVDREEVKGVIEPLPSYVINPKSKNYKERVVLGKKLYFEKRLSIANDISCNSCHKLDQFGVDNEPTSPGHKGQRGGRNSPTVFNAGLHLAQFWDGRAKDLKEQAKGPILNPIEMAMPSEKEVLKRISSDNEYKELFKRAYPGVKKPFTYDNLANAIATFESNLLTPSRFDQWLSGNDQALTADEKEGLRLFTTVGCTTCHNGPGIGGGMYQKLGLEVPYPNLKDDGRFSVTKDEDDRYFFKVPSLRNIAKTSPYFHDGSIKSLDEAIQLMGKHQLNIELNRDQRTYIKKFLESLTGSHPEMNVVKN